jgi:hypothetical protein
MLASFGKLAVDASECQRDWSGHSPGWGGEQGLLAEKLALKYDACQFRSLSLIPPAKPEARISTCGKLLPTRPFSTDR